MTSHDVVLLCLIFLFLSLSAKQILERMCCLCSMPVVRNVHVCRLIQKVILSSEKIALPECHESSWSALGLENKIGLTAKYANHS